jgi:hypothetical protein
MDQKPRIAVMIALWATIGTANADLRIGGFDAGRGGMVGISDGAWFSTLRTYITGACPSVGASFSGTGTLTPAYLAGIDVLFISTIKDGSAAITPLSPAEQAALLQFVLGGGGVVILADNAGVAGSGPGSPNGSCLSVFGCDAGGASGAPATITVIQVHPVTAGPYGTTSSFHMHDCGWFTSLGPGSAMLGRWLFNNSITLAAIDRSVLGPGSGAVVLFSDTSFLFNDFLIPGWPDYTESRKLALNAIAFVSPPTAPPADCYANCDGSSLCPVLNVNDFICYLQQYAAAETWANCDQSTAAPVLNVNDFLCFVNRFAEGCH